MNKQSSKKRIVSIVIALTLLLSLSIPVCAATYTSSDYGTVTYYTNASGNGIGACTQITKPASNVLVKVTCTTVRKVSGATIGTLTDSGYNRSQSYVLGFLYGADIPAIGYGCHEVYGKSNFLRYTSSTLN